MSRSGERVRMSAARIKDPPNCLQREGERARDKERRHLAILIRWPVCGPVGVAVAGSLARCCVTDSVSLGVETGLRVITSSVLISALSHGISVQRLQGQAGKK